MLRHYQEMARRSITAEFESLKKENLASFISIILDSGALPLLTVVVCEFETARPYHNVLFFGADFQLMTIETLPELSHHRHVGIITKALLQCKVISCQWDRMIYYLLCDGLYMSELQN